MSQQNELSDKIKQWVTLDNELKKLNEKIKELRENRNILCDDIIEYVNDNELSHATIKISDGNLKFVETKQYQPLTMKYIEECLNKFISDDQKIKEIMKYIKTSREIKLNPEIKRTYNKN